MEPDRPDRDVPFLLTELEEEYRGRRNIESRFVRDVVRLAREGVAAVEARERAAREAHEAAYGSLAKAFDQERVALLEAHRVDLDKAREQRDEWKGHYDRIRDREVAETRENDGENTKIKFRNPDGGYKAPWQVQHLESIAYKIRVAGGDDFTRVLFENATAEASVPCPDFVDLRPPGYSPPEIKTSPIEAMEAKVVKTKDRAKIQALALGGALFAVFELVRSLVS